LHHVTIEAWSQQVSFLHAADPRAKVIALLLFLIAVGVINNGFGPAAVVDFGMLLTLIVAAGLPPAGMLSKSALVLPFSFVFALISILAGDPRRAALLIAKSYLSALAVLLLAATTPLPALLRAVEWFRAPRYLLMVMQFLYRYLFVISEEAQHMRIAAVSRGGGAHTLRMRHSGFRAAAGAVGVLFARSHARAQDIHYSMLSRGFSGSFPVLAHPRWRLGDSLLLAAAGLFLILHFSLGRLL
jgi:cobalt/nickel transport system permease protein